VRHATDADLDAIEAVLAELRVLPGLRERKRGSFSRGSHAFVHFHEHEGRYFADVKLAASFERRSVTTASEQSAFIDEVRRVLGSFE
jgi:hypothetical protein